MTTLSVLIVEDDFRVAGIIEDAVHNGASYQVVNKTKTARETIDFLKSCPSLPDLVLLDVYIPDADGLSLLREIRELYGKLDIIMITAARETETIQEAIRSGIYDYILKPIDFQRFQETLKQYASHHAMLQQQGELEQEDIDRLIHQKKNTASRLDEVLPKGIDPATLEHIKNSLNKEQAGVSAAKAAGLAGVSRPTARRYLEYLASINYAEVFSSYGDPGRPQRLYQVTARKN
ncbi:response regulator [Sinobaca sp. H24]|uniref:response regulator n=1 Tax=Sinobaca sp. H24 TaxID=2923376 RepID=UPI00207B0D46|nr:response regulator [Sinobaca sp. H24]